MRILSPEDYGIVALATVVITGLQQFEDFGINIALVRRNKLSNRVIKNAQTIKIFISLLLYVLGFVGSYFWAMLYHFSELKTIIRILAITILFDAVMFLDKVVLIRGLDFKRKIIPELIRALIAPAFTLLFAVMGYKYMSIVYGTVLGAFCQMIAYKLIVKQPIIIGYNKKIALKLLYFGFWILIGNLLFWAYTTFDNAIIGKVLGFAALGYYAVAYRWGTFIAENIQGVLPEILLPAYSLINKNISRLREAFLKVLYLNSLIVLPLSVIFAVVADWFIVLFLGDKWLLAYHPLLILLIFGTMRSLQASSGTIFFVLNKPYINTILQTVTLVGLLILIYPMIVWKGIIGGALAITGSFLISFIIQQFYITKELRLNFYDLFRPVKTPFISSFIMLLILYFIKPLFKPTYIYFVLLCLAGCLIYLIMLRFINKDDFKRLLKLSFHAKS